jgi:hypothetical protein
MLGPPLLPRNLEASVRDIASARPDVRAAAVADLVRHARGDDAVRERAMPLLIERLQDPQPIVRSAVAVGLGDLRAKEAVTALLVAVEDEDAQVRQMALNALGEIGDARALPRLRRGLKDPRPEVRYQSVIALARVADLADSIEISEVDDVLFSASSDEDYAVSHIALRVAEERLDAGHRPEGRLLARARAIVESRGSPQVALVAAILLAKAGDERGHDLVSRVVRGERIGAEAPDKEDERAAVELAGELGMKDLAQHLERRAWGFLRFVRDTCPFHARIALARMGHDRAIKEILSELRSSRREVLEGAVVAAGRARLATARPLVEGLPDDTVDPELKCEALARLTPADDGAKE